MKENNNINFIASSVSGKSLLSDTSPVEAVRTQNDEIWKFIAGFGERYEVSNFGRVRVNRIWTSGRETQKIKKQRTTRKGYRTITLYQTPYDVLKSVHRLVAIAFIPNPDNKPQVNHKDGIKTNNRVDNLEWTTAKENMRHAAKNGLLKPPKGEKSHKAKLKNSQILFIKQLLSENKPHWFIADLFNVCEATISRINRGYNWTDLN